ncbi:MAG: ABC transporter ATP-binding protein [Lachnospiraceae bacterium]|nr:ABC transporter ATP-binding protein [Lachnospiraceae bacterium]
MGQIVLKNIGKSFGSTKVLEDLNLTINDGEFAVLVGASGCGKTTLLRIIAGIGPATSGELYIDGEEVSDLDPGKRNIAMVFQNYAIYPNMTVKGNIEFGLKNNHVPKAERERLIAEVAESVGLTEYLKRKPSALSGGQRQRVALARAMVKNPKVFLMDEPLSNLDAKLRVQMRSELIELHKKLKTTFVYVTHDQVEAMSMADTIILMNQGVIQQQASPEVIYADPNNVFTAQFIGTPSMNVLPLGNGSYVGYRPEKAALTIGDNGMPDAIYRRKARIITREMLGSETLYKVELQAENARGETIMVKSLDDAFREEQEVWVNVAVEHLYFFDEKEQRIRESDRADAYAACLRCLKGE